MSTFYIDYTGTPPLCAECGQPFTLEEWDDRHTGAEDDGWPDIHAACCEKTHCKTCGGTGEVPVEVDVIVDEVSHDMAMDAENMALQGQPIWGKVTQMAPCPDCHKENQ